MFLSWSIDRLLHAFLQIFFTAICGGGIPQIRYICLFQNPLKQNALQVTSNPRAFSGF